MGAAAGGGPSADVTVQMGPCALGELRSLAELLDEVKDGDDREDRDEVTVGGGHRRGGGGVSDSNLSNIRSSF